MSRKLKVIKGLRLADDDLKQIDPEKVAGAEKLQMLGAVYIVDHVVEPSEREANFLLEAFPENFVEADQSAPGVLVP